MKTPTRRRARFFLILVLCLAVAASAAGLVISRQGGSQAQAAVPGSASTRADLGTMQAALNSGSVSAQAALLVPGFKFAAGSKPVFPAGTKVTVEQATFRSDGRFGTIRAGVSGGSPVTLGLYAAGGHWRLYAVRADSAQTRASTTRQPGRPATAELMASTSSSTVKACPSRQEIGNRVPVVLIHGFMPGSAADWGQDGDPGSMFYAVDMIPGTWTSAFDYSRYNGEWVDNPAIGKRFVTYLDCVAQASKAGGGPGKVIVVAHSMGGLATRWAANNGAGDAIAEVITLGTPNTGATIAGLGDATRQLLCDTQSMLRGPDASSFCTEFTALAGMDRYGDQIANLPELPDSIPLYAIAGDVTIKDPLGGAWIDAHWDGDGLVPVSSALHQPPGSGQFTTSSIACTNSLSCWHGALPKNAAAQADVRNLVRTYVKAHYGRPVPSAQGPQPVAGHPAGPDCDSAVNAVYNFYDDLNAHNYQAAWSFLAPGVAGASYDSWVAGYSGAAGIYVTAQGPGCDVTSGVVQVSITATQADGTVQHYAGTYTLRETDYRSWTIESADIHATSGTAPAPAQALGGDAYWLAGGGQWYVHGEMLHISRGPSGLIGEESWNAGGTVITGHARLAFASQLDGSLAGTFTTSAWYTEERPLPPGLLPPSTPEVLKGQTFTLTPIAPMFAKSAPGGNSPAAYAGVGNPYLCQAGLAQPEVRSCGA